MKVSINLWDVSTKYAVISTHDGTTNITLTDDKDYIKRNPNSLVCRLGRISITDGILELNGHVLLIARAFEYADNGWRRVQYTVGEFAEKCNATVETISEVNETYTKPIMKRKWYGVHYTTGKTKTYLKNEKSFTGREVPITVLYSSFKVIDKGGIINWGGLPHD
tara:strand:+ start:3796 stop:4290 length:495 start_codon:yes stop_codon:yes gene_type:complete